MQFKPNLNQSFDIHHDIFQGGGFKKISRWGKKKFGQIKNIYPTLQNPDVRPWLNPTYSIHPIQPLLSIPSNLLYPSHPTYSIHHIHPIQPLLCIPHFPLNTTVSSVNVLEIIAVHTESTVEGANPTSSNHPIQPYIFIPSNHLYSSHPENLNQKQSGSRCKVKWIRERIKVQ